MPTYEYYCPANGKALEVKHSMSLRLGTWGELCDLAGIETGSIDPQTPVEKLMSGGNILTQKSVESNGGGSGCGSGNCGHHHH
jgi:hypothetical protein